MKHPSGSYRFYDNEKYGKAMLIDVPAEVASRKGEWFNQNMTTVNDTAVRLSVMNGEYHWHKHDTADEFFFVLEGELCVDFVGQETVVLGQHCAYTVPMGVTHRTRAPKRAVALVIEPATIAPAGD